MNNNNNSQSLSFTISRTLLAEAVYRAPLSKANEIYDTTSHPNLDRTLATLVDMETFPRCPVGAIMLHVLPPDVSLADAEEFIHRVACKGKMQVKDYEVLLRQKNYLGALSAFYEDSYPTKPTLMRFINQHFPESIEVSLGRLLT